MATLTISLKKITSEVKFAKRKSALLQNNNLWKKFCPLSAPAFVQSYKVTPPLHHPKKNLMSKWHLIQPLQRKIYNAYLLDSRPDQKSLVTYYTLRSLYVRVWLVKILTSTAPIGSPIICMWSPADICEQWERNLSFSSADVCGAGTRYEPLRTSAWEAMESTSGEETSIRRKSRYMSELSSSLARIWLSEKESRFEVDVGKSFPQEKCPQNPYFVQEASKR